MSSVEVCLTQMNASIQKHVTAFSWWHKSSIAFVIAALVLYRLSVIRAEIQRRRRDIPQGLLRVVSHGVNPQFEIIAVQGLGSDPDSTWKSKAAVDRNESDLLEKLLPQRLPNARISKFIYNSDWDHDGSAVSPQQIGEDLVRAFDSHSQAHPILPIIFLGHSFGGIVIKYALVESASTEKDHKLWASTRGIVFLGTPHLGSSLSQFATGTAYINRFFGSRMELPVGLQSGHPSLSDIKDKFQHQLDREKFQRVRILAVQEMKPVNLFGVFSLGWVVGRDSAAEHAHERVAWECSHTELNKFRNSTEERFKKIVGYINSLAPSSILKSADETLRHTYLSGQKLDIIRFSGELLKMEQCYINLGTIKITSKNTGNVRPGALEPLQQQSLMARLSLEQPRETERLELSTLFDQTKTVDEGDKKRVKKPVKRILIRGQAGIGKSTLCKKIVYEFYNNQMWRTKFDRILWIPLRHVRRLKENDRSLENLLVKELISDENRELATTMYHQLRLNKFDRTLFLLDGLDEVHSSLNDEDDDFKALFDSLIDKPNVIVTSRPHFRVRQRRVPFDMEAEVLGLTSEQIEDYITNSPYGSSEEIRDFLDRNDLIQGLVRIPIQLEALCYTWNEKNGRWNSKDPPRTMTELYQAMEIKFRRKDLVRRNLLTQSKVEARTNDEVQNFRRRDIELMECLAFSGLCLREVNFDNHFRDATLKHFKIEQLPSGEEESVASVLHDLSFLRSSDQEQEPKTVEGTYHFLHLTFQEYFAALYFARKWKNNQPLIYLSLNDKKGIEKKDISANDFLHETKYFPSFDVFWRFACGLLKPTANAAKDHQNDFFNALETSNKDLLGLTHQRLVMNCLMEARQEMPLRSRMESQISRWLRLEIRSQYSGQISRMAECPDSIIIGALGDCSLNARSNIFQALEVRSSLSPVVLEAIYYRCCSKQNHTSMWGAASRILKKHPLPTNVKESILKVYRNDPEVRFDVAEIIIHFSNGFEILSDDLTAWRRDSVQGPRRETFRLLDGQPNIDDKLTDSILAPLPDDDLYTRSLMISLLMRQKVLTPNVLQAVFQYFPSEERPYDSSDYLKGQVFSRSANIENCWLELLKRHQKVSEHSIALLLKHSRKTYVREYLRHWWKLEAPDDHVSDPIITKLISLLEYEDIYVRWQVFLILATQKHLSNESLDTIITILQASQMEWVVVPSDLNRVKLSDQFLQRFESLLINGEASIRQFVTNILCDKHWVSNRDRDKLKTVFQNPDEVEYRHLQLCQRLDALPRQLEESIATLLSRPDPKINSTAYCILQRNGPLADSTLKTVVRYLEQDHSQDFNPAAIEALHGLKELQDDIWNYFEKLLDSEEYTRLPIIQALGDFKRLPSGMVEALARLLEDEDEKYLSCVHHLMFRYKGQIPESALKYIMSRFEANSNRKTVRIAIAEALGAQIFDSPMASSFVNSLVSDDKDVQLAFSKSFSRSRSVLNPNIDIILPLLEVSTGDTRGNIIERIYLEHDRPTTNRMAQVIAPLLEVGYGKMLEHAAKILARHYSGDYFPEIVKLFRSSDSCVRNSAYGVLSNMAELSTAVIDALADLLQDQSAGHDAKSDALKTLEDGKYDQETASSKTLLSIVMPLLEDKDLRRYALGVLQGYKDLSGRNLGKIMLKIGGSFFQGKAFRVISSHCGEEEISSLLNDYTAVAPFWELAWDYSWTEVVSIYFLEKDTIRVITPNATRTITLKNPVAFVERIQAAREEFCQRYQVASPWVDGGSSSSEDNSLFACGLMKMQRGSLDRFCPNPHDLAEDWTRSV